MNYTYGNKFEDCQDNNIIYIQILDIRKEDGKIDVFVKSDNESYGAEWSISQFEHGLKTRRYKKIEGLFA